MRAIKLRVNVGRDHRVELELPPEIPEGEVEIIILSGEVTDSSQAGTLRQFFDEVDRLPRRRRTKEEIDRYIAEERGSWE